MQAKFTHAIKFVADMDKAVAFYRDTIGLTLRFASPEWSEFETGDVTLALHTARPDNPPGDVELGFTAPDLRAIYDGREQTGLNFTGAPRAVHGTLLTQLLDSEGVGISLSGKP